VNKLLIIKNRQRKTMQRVFLKPFGAPFNQC